MAVSEDTARKIYAREGFKCWACHKYLGTKIFNRGEIHHALFGRNRNKPELDAEENLLLLCREDHQNIGGYETKKRVWAYLCEIYGENHMLAWHESLDMKSKERFD